ncbi:MAG: hypothetical protein AAGH90_06605 [Pseudomonadota bacterium]
MDADAFARRVGDRLIHVTLIENLAGIKRHGLLRPTRLAQMCGVSADEIAPRNKAIVLQANGFSARLNHQKPLLAGRNQVPAFLDGHTLQSWAQQLDERVFFWPQRRGQAFAASLQDRGAQAVFELDSRRFFEAFADNVYLSPINSGSAMRRASPRGDWIYVPVLAGWEAFATNRQQRGLTRTRDSVVEVSLRSDVPAPVLTDCLR